MIVGLFLQQVVALFVLKTSAGYSLFRWIATLASDFLAEAYPAAEFFFDAETIAKHWYMDKLFQYSSDLTFVSGSLSTLYALCFLDFFFWESSLLL